MNTWQLLCAGALLLTAGFFLRSEYEKSSLLLQRYELISDRVPRGFDGYRILYLTDLHSVSFGPHNSSLTGIVRETAPDLILFGGDMLTVRRGKSFRTEALRELLSGTGGIPVLYGLGNHEVRLFQEPFFRMEKQQFSDLIRESGVKLLDNETVPVTRNGDRIWVSGLTIAEEQCRKGRKRPLAPDFIGSRIRKEDGFRILLYHSPLYLCEMLEWGADLFLAGHFHGGTVRLPLLGGVMTPQLQFFYPYCRGRFDLGGRTAVVSGGLGTHSVRIRFRNRPEPVLITLRRKEQA